MELSKEERRKISLQKSQRVYREKNLEEVRAKGRERYQKNKDAWNERVRAKRKLDGQSARDANNERNRSRWNNLSDEKKKEYSKRNWENNKEKLIANRRMKKYGISQEQYDEMLKSQGYSCAICKTSVDDLSKSLAVDHDHSSGKVRDLLCMKCNIDLHFVENRAHLFEVMLEYLNKHGMEK